MIPEDSRQSSNSTDDWVKKGKISYLKIFFLQMGLVYRPITVRVAAAERGAKSVKILLSPSMDID